MRSLQWYKRGAAYLQIAHGIETEARPVRSWAETTFLCPTDFTDFPGEGWVKGGEGSAQPFTRASYLATDIYAILVKGEGYF